MNRYYRYSAYLKQKYARKTYKITLNIPSGCPNRDGTLSKDGCIFCAPDGSGHENAASGVALQTQWKTAKALIEEKYKAEAFIAYFQSFSNTYLPEEQFENYMQTAAQLDSCVALAISTRPDCIAESHLSFLSALKKETGVDISIELGLQSANDDTLKVLNRCHTAADVLDVGARIKKAGLELCLHMITSLPWDSERDVIHAAGIANELDCESVKVHSLYVPKGTMLEEMVRTGKVTLLSQEDFIDRTIVFLEHLDADIAVQRLVSRVTEERDSPYGWHKSWWKVLEELEAEMDKRDSFQGKNVNICGKTWYNIGD
jgi:hypothetical protein